MKKLITIVLVLGLFLGITGISFAQTMFGPSTGYYRFNDEYVKENFGRVQNGIIFNFDLSYYPKKSPVPIGVYSKISIAGLISGYEWKDDDKIKSISNGSYTDVFLFVSPSYKFKLGERVELPVSFGPSFRMSFISIDNNYKDDDSYYEAINLGLTAEASLLVYTIDWIYLKFGVSGSYDFFRQERGTMNMEYRKKTITRYNSVDYKAFALSIFMGVGFKLGGSS